MTGSTPPERALLLCAELVLGDGFEEGVDGWGVFFVLAAKDENAVVDVFCERDGVDAVKEGAFTIAQTFVDGEADKFGLHNGVEGNGDVGIIVDFLGNLLALGVDVEGVDVGGA